MDAIARKKKAIPRDPEATRKRIVLAARTEFAQRGLGGARVDQIAARAKTNKRMLYHYFGNKDALFRHTLEEAYSAFRKAEAELHLENDPPITALRRLVSFTWDYYLDHPEFITLVNSENLHKARHLKASPLMDQMNRPFLARMEQLLDRGKEQGLFYDNLDPVQILITVAGVGFHYLNNRHTGAIVYGRNLMSEEALEARRRFNIDSILKIVCQPATYLAQTHNEVSP
jgi:AcrR family transcriptional regulator